MFQLRRSSILLIAVLATASCVSGVGSKVESRKAATTLPGRTENPTAAGQSALSLATDKKTLNPGLVNVPPSGLDTVRRDALIASISNVVAASRASKITAALSAISGVLSNNAAGLISNNGGSIISDNGGGIISDNGGGIISNNGSSLTSKTKYSLFADLGATATGTATGTVNLAGNGATAAASGTASVLAAATGQAVAGASTPALAVNGNTPVVVPGFDGFVPQHFSAETSGLVYVVVIPTPITGGFKSFDRATYASLPDDQKNTSLVDDFSWDNVVTQHPFNGDELKIGLEYHLKKNFSKRLPFSDRMISREILAIVPSATSLTTKSVGWEIEFNLDVALVGGDRDHASFKAIAGENDLVEIQQSNGGTLTSPTHLKLTGKNDRGNYTGTIEGHDKIDISVTHTTAAGIETVLVVHTLLDGTSSESITVPSLNLAVAIDVDAKGGGKGHLDDTKGAKPVKIGDITWDTAGVATIVLPDGSSFKATLF
jgi:hypothetical protein